MHGCAGAILGLGLAYAGTCRAEVAELLTGVVEDGEVAMELAGFAALSLGLVYQVRGRPGPGPQAGGHFHDRDHDRDHGADDLWQACPCPCRSCCCCCWLSAGWPRGLVAVPMAR